MIKVSVIMPVYNSEKHLKTALESILKQTLKEIEIICIDDGSTDASVQILQEYQKRDDRIIIAKQNHSNAGTARNYGMEIATGKYYSFLDSDDYFVPQMLEKAYLNAEDQQADLVIFDGEYFVDELRSAYDSADFLAETLIPDGAGFDNKKKLPYIMNISNPAPWNKLFLSKFIKKNQIKFQECRRGNDLFFVEMALVLAEKIGVVKENLVYYRTGNGMSLQGTVSESPDYFISILSDIRAELKKRKMFDEVEKSFKSLCLDNCIYNLDNVASPSSLEKLYGVIKEYAFKEFEILDSFEKDYYNPYLYQEYLFVKEHSLLEYCMERYRKKCKRNTVKKYLFPFEKVGKDSRIILYGGGRVGRSFYDQIRKNRYCILESWADKKVKEYDSFPLMFPEQVNWHKSDYIVVAIEKRHVAAEIINNIHEAYAVPYEKIIWEDPVL